MRLILPTSLAVLLCGLPCLAQSAPANDQPAAPKPPAALTPSADFRNRDVRLDPLRVYRLESGGGPNHGNEVLLGLRMLLDPSCKLDLVDGENTILLRCGAEVFPMADQIVHELDRPKPNYRVTYSIAESDNNHRLGVQHFSLTVAAGTRATLKDGSKVTVATSSSQSTIYDVGLNLDVELTQGTDGVRLRSKVDQSSLEETKAVNGFNQPIIRQSTLEGTSLVVVGKPVMLGSIDIPGSTRHQDVEVLLEQVK